MSTSAERNGGIDVLFNNAANGALEPIDAIEPEGWDDTMALQA